MQCIASFKLLHVTAPQCHPQGVYGTAVPSSGSLLERRNLRIGLVFLCSSRLLEDGTVVP